MDNFWSEQTVCPRKSVVKTPICPAEDNHTVPVYAVFGQNTEGMWRDSPEKWQSYLLKMEGAPPNSR
jgi:hypothetical protein